MDSGKVCAQPEHTTEADVEDEENGQDDDGEGGDEADFVVGSIGVARLQVGI